MSKWEIERTEVARFYLSITDAEDRRVRVSRGAPRRVTSVGVRFQRQPGGAWSGPRVSVTFGRDWDMQVVRVPDGLHKREIPPWLAALIEECQP